MRLSTYWLCEVGLQTSVRRASTRHMTGPTPIPMKPSDRSSNESALEVFTSRAGTPCLVMILNGGVNCKRRVPFPSSAGSFSDQVRCGLLSKPINLDPILAGEGETHSRAATPRWESSLRFEIGGRSSERPPADDELSRWVTCTTDDNSESDCLSFAPAYR